MRFSLVVENDARDATRAQDSWGTNCFGEKEGEELRAVKRPGILLTTPTIGTVGQGLFNWPSTTGPVVSVTDDIISFSTPPGTGSTIKPWFLVGSPGTGEGSVIADTDIPGPPQEIPPWDGVTTFPINQPVYFNGATWYAGVVYPGYSPTQSPHNWNTTPFKIPGLLPSDVVFSVAAFTGSGTTINSGYNMHAAVSTVQTNQLFFAINQPTWRSWLIYTGPSQINFGRTM